jgi:tRNA pseudouridine55 synthase
MPDDDPGALAGLLIIDKPSGCTSHDVVAQVRRWTQVRRVGHAGTLDPQATGVLLIGLGAGTKLIQFLHESPKIYRATVRLGVRTDTYDAAGKVVEVHPVPALHGAEVEAVLTGFRGDIEQIPPMFSALKQQGRRLYTLARQGIDVDRPPRRVHIFRLVLLESDADRLQIEVECTSGTYIRVLADDIGRRLGCGAHLSALRRTAVGPFVVDQALTLAVLQEAVRQHAWQHHVRSLSEALAAFPALVLTASAAQGLTHGVAPRRQGVQALLGGFAAGETVALRGPAGEVFALGSAACGAAVLEGLPPQASVVRLRRVLR